MKPHIFFRRGWWFCNWRQQRICVQGSGRTPTEAYKTWSVRCVERLGPLGPSLGAFHGPR